MNKLMFATILGAALALSHAHADDQAASKPVSLGVQIMVTPEGPEIVDMLPDRTAAAIGFRLGDILVEVGGKPISEEVLMEYLQEKKAGDQLSFKVKRADVVIELTGEAIAAAEGAPAPQPEG